MRGRASDPHRFVAIGVLGAIWLVLLGRSPLLRLSLMNERRQELAVWRSIGASRAIVSRIMLGESGLLHAAGALVGTGLAALVLPLVGERSVVEALHVPRRRCLSPGLSIVVVTCVGIVGTRLALARVSRAAAGSKSVLI